MERSRICIRRILKHEGGFVNHPHDPGGATNMGVTFANYRRFINPHGSVSDLRRMTVDQAITVYERRYWGVVWADKMPVGVDYALADYAVNSGPGRAAKHLQQVIGVKADGVVGPITLRIAKSKDPAWLVSALCDRRLRFLHGLRIWRHFGRGWARRVEDVRKDALADIEAAP